MVRVGLVGSGFAARFHYQALKKVHGVRLEVAGVWSPTPGRCQPFASERGLRVFPDLDALCDAVDVVDACVPGASHEPVALRALARGRHVIVEKPFSGYFGADDAGFRGDNFPKETMLREALASAERMREAEQSSGRRIFYAENWVYAPAIEKEREIIVKSKAQVLWMMGGESHSGSHSPYYGIWRFSGGGSLVGKACHPLTAALYLKREEGLARTNRRAIRPAAASCRTHNITRLPGYQDLGTLRTDYLDVEDYSQLHVVFDDGTVADIFATEVVLGGVSNWMEICANNHRTRANLNPVDALTTYNPREDFFSEIYVVEKIGTKQGWSHPAPDEDWQHGYPQEMQDFMECAEQGREPRSGSELGRDTVAVVYAGYLSAERHGAEVKIG